jgi:hypothetical protein
MWRALINNFVSGGSVAIKVNDDTGHYFQTRKGPRHGDPLSPMLLNIVADMLTIMIEHVIRLKRICNFRCSMLVFTPFALCFVTLRGIFMRFLELTY